MTFHNLSLHFRLPNHQKKVIFNRLNLRFPDQGLIVITGDSGVGKSSLLKVIARLIIPSTGKVTLPYSKSLLKPIYLSDQLELFPQWKVNDYVLNSSQFVTLKNLGFVEADLHKPYCQLSIGQQVRLKMVLFLDQPANVYLLDEPTHALDEFNRDKLIALLVKQSTQKSIIIATHDQKLIEQAEVVLNIQSAFQTSLSYHPPRSKLTNEFGIKEKFPQVNPWHHWFRKLEKIHRGGILGWFLSFAAWVVQIGIFLSMTIGFHMQRQWDYYSQLVNSDPWLEIVEIQTVPIHDSPFQLVKTFFPSQDSFNALFQDVNNTLWLVDLSTWFPKAIEINNVMVNIRFIDLPFEMDRLTTSWIYPKQTLPQTLTLSTITIPNQEEVFTFSGPIQSINHRVPLTWFEPPQLLLSYWQWLAILTQQETFINDVKVSYFSKYLTLLPPSHALIFNSKYNQVHLLENLNEHPWRFTIPTEKAYPLMKPLMVPILSIFPIVLVCLVLIWIALWWSILHWMFHLHRRHLQWMIMMHQSFKKIWLHLTRKLYLQSSLFHGLTMMLMTFFLPHQSIIPSPNLMMILIVQTIMWIGLESLRLNLRGWFKYA